MIRRLLKKTTKTPPNTSDEVMESTIKPLFFVHIPKTAGTSFRKALEAMQPMEKDYGANACETSVLVRTFMHDNVTPYALKQEMLAKPFALTGHVHIQKYADFFDIRNIVTFVREPIGQIVSHYNHFINHNGFKGDFAQFYRAGQFRNVQARYLNGFPLTLVGHVGITERYDDSLTLINHCLGLALVPLRKNIGERTSQQKNELPHSVIEELMQFNELDVQSYKQAVEIHQQRKELLVQGKEWSHIHAYVNANGVLHGCAYFSASEEPVNLIVKINGEEKATVVAQEFCGLFPKFNFPRQRYVGFSLPLAKFRDSGIGELQLMVTTTGQTYDVEPPKL